MGQEVIKVDQSNAETANKGLEPQNETERQNNLLAALKEEVLQYLDEDEKQELGTAELLREKLFVRPVQAEDTLGAILGALGGKVKYSSTLEYRSDKIKTPKNRRIQKKAEREDRNMTLLDNPVIYPGQFVWIEGANLIVGDKSDFDEAVKKLEDQLQEEQAAAQREVAAEAARMATETAKAKNAERLTKITGLTTEYVRLATKLKNPGFQPDKWQKNPGDITDAELVKIKEDIAALEAEKNTRREKFNELVARYKELIPQLEEDQNKREARLKKREPVNDDVLVTETDLSALESEVDELNQQLIAKQNNEALAKQAAVEKFEKQKGRVEAALKTAAEVLQKESDFADSESYLSALQAASESIDSELAKLKELKGGSYDEVLTAKQNFISKLKEEIRAAESKIGQEKQNELVATTAKELHDLLQKPDPADLPELKEHLKVLREKLKTLEGQTGDPQKLDGNLKISLHLLLRNAENQIRRIENKIKSIEAKEKREAQENKELVEFFGSEIPTTPPELREKAREIKKSFEFIQTELQEYLTKELGIQGKIEFSYLDKGFDEKGPYADMLLKINGKEVIELYYDSYSPHFECSVRAGHFKPQVEGGKVKVAYTPDGDLSIDSRKFTKVKKILKAFKKQLTREGVDFYSKNLNKSEQQKTLKTLLLQTITKSVGQIRSIQITPQGTLKMIGKNPRLTVDLKLKFTPEGGINLKDALSRIDALFYHARRAKQVEKFQRENAFRQYFKLAKEFQELAAQFKDLRGGEKDFRETPAKKVDEILGLDRNLDQKTKITVIWKKTEAIKAHIKLLKKAVRHAEARKEMAFIHTPETHDGELKVDNLKNTIEIAGKKLELDANIGDIQIISRKTKPGQAKKDVIMISRGGGIPKAIEYKADDAGDLQAKLEEAGVIKPPEAKTLIGTNGVEVNPAAGTVKFGAEAFKFKNDNVESIDLIKNSGDEYFRFKLKNGETCQIISRANSPWTRKGIDKLVKLSNQERNQGAPSRIEVSQKEQTFNINGYKYKVGAAVGSFGFEKPWLGKNYIFLKLKGGEEMQIMQKDQNFFDKLNQWQSDGYLEPA